MKTNTGVIVLGGSSSKNPTPTAISVLRCLSKENIPTLLVSSKENEPAMYSKHVHRYFISDSSSHCDTYLQILMEIGKNYPNYVLMPTSDDTIKLVSDNREILSKQFRVPMPEKRVIDICLNKQKSYEVAIQNGISIPRTFKCSSIEELKKVSEIIPYPCILKPSSNQERKFFPKKVIEIASPHQFIIYCKVLMKNGCSPIIQEKIIGPPSNLYSLGAVLDFSHKPIAVFTGRKIRQIAYDFGVATYCESLWVPEVAELGLKLLRSINYSGIAQVEFKLDPQDKKFKLMEINARPWFWISLTSACGMNLPYIVYKMALGEDACVNEFKEGVRWQWLSGDLGLLLTQIIAKKSDFSFENYFKSLLRRRVFATFTIKDPAPFFKEMTQSILYLRNYLKDFV